MNMVRRRRLLRLLLQWLLSEHPMQEKMQQEMPQLLFPVLSVRRIVTILLIFNNLPMVSHYQRHQRHQRHQLQQYRHWKTCVDAFTRDLLFQEMMMMMMMMVVVVAQRCDWVGKTVIFLHLHAR
jgi:hypothetical protein